MQSITELDTNHKYITILGIKYRIKDKTTLIQNEQYPTETTGIHQFNWSNIDSVEYSDK